jgi:hypothetical protein
MADTTVTYRTVYEGDSTKAVAAIDRYIAAIDKLEAKLDKLQVKLKDFGKNTPGLASAITAVAALGKELASADATADKTTKAVAAVGTNNSGINAATAAANHMAAALTAAAAAAHASAAANASIPPPPAMPGRGGGGGGVGDVAKGALIARAVGASVGLSVQAVRAGGKAIGDAGGDERALNAALAEKAMAYRESQLDAAHVEGKKTVDDEFVRSQVAFQKKTGMHNDEAAVFRTQFQGAVQSGKLRGNINDKTAGELMTHAATFAVRTGMDAQTGGKLSGLLGEFGKVGSAEEGMGKLGEMEHHLNILGVGDIGQLAKPFLGLMGEMVDEDGGRVKDPVALSAMFAASTIRSRSPATAATSIRQSNRVLRKMVGQGVGGVTSDDDYMEGLKKVAPQVTGKNGDQWLRDQGFHNDAENQALIKQARLIPVVDAQLKDPKAKESRDNAIALNKKFMDSKVGRNRTAENNILGAELDQGMKSERVETLRKEAHARLADPNQPGGPRIGTTATNLTDKLTYLTNGGGVYGADERVDQDLLKNLRDRAGAAGMTGETKMANGESMAKALKLALDTSGTSRGAQSVVLGTPTSVDERRRNVIDEAAKFIEAAEKQTQAAADQLRAAQAMQAAAQMMQAVGAGSGSLMGSLFAGPNAVVPAR